MYKLEIGKKVLPGLLLFVSLVLVNVMSHAGEAQPMAADPEMEKRVVEITSELRCLKCQNQTIADSKAGLADDLKQKVRDMVALGKSKDEIITYMTDRYGDFVRYNPAFKPSTLPLWIGPFIFVVLGIVALFFVFKDRQKKLADGNPKEILDDERLQKLIDDN